MSSHNVKEYGAAGDGSALDQEAIQKAIDACHAEGGGRVYVPPGRYLSGTLRLRANICLYLEMGARIVAADDPSLFPEICKTPYGNLPGQIQSLLFADDAENITVAGHGAVDGNANSALPPEVAATVFFRPALVFFRNCRRVRFLDVSLQYSPFWTLHLLRCDDVMIRGCMILAHPDRINTDGIDPDGCRDVIISDCRIDTGDDCIVVKSTEGDACENIVITNCTLRSSQTALKLGTEAIGDIRNIIFENVFMTGNGRCYLEGQPAHPLENIVFRNVTWTVTGPCRYEGARKPPGACRIDPDPDAENYAEREAQVVAVHVDGLTIDEFKLMRRNDAPSRTTRFFHEVVESGGQ